MPRAEDTSADAEDPRAARDAWLRALSRTAAIDAEPEHTLPVRMDAWAARSGDATALCFGERSLSYARLAARAHRYAHWGLAQGFRAGDVIALLLANGPEYLPIWLGLTRLGVIVALLNTHLSATALAHSIRVAAAVDRAGAAAEAR